MKAFTEPNINEGTATPSTSLSVPAVRDSGQLREKQGHQRQTRLRVLFAPGVGEVPYERAV